MLTSKQRAYLRSLATSIDTIIMVGKGGLSEQLYKSTDDAIRSRELIKGKVLEACDVPVKEVATSIAEEINAEVVQTIGTKFVLYRRNEDEPVIELPRGKK